ncbi:hypothetical protein PTKIN_Ptkin05aG0133000 [Pterospermum kingtungense]
MAFSHLEVSDSNYKSCSSNDKWDRIEKLSQFLGVFYEITCVFSGSKYPITSSYFLSIFWARFTLEKHMKGNDVQLQKMAKLMFDKFENKASTYGSSPVVDKFMNKGGDECSRGMVGLHSNDAWKQSHFRYPELASMAQDVLTILVSMVASELAFSVGGKVLDQYHSSLKPNIVEVIVCSKDWLFGETDNNLGDMLSDAINLDLNKDDSTSTSVKSSTSTQVAD